MDAVLVGSNETQQLSQPSPTVNTREAQMLIQEMWGSQYLSSSKTLQEEPKGNILYNNTPDLCLYMQINIHDVVC